MTIDISYANKLYKSKDYTAFMEYCLSFEQIEDGDILDSIGICYREQRGVEKDLDKAIFYFEKAFEFGYIKAANRLGNIYRTESSKKDVEKAIYWYSIGAEKDDPIALYYLGNIYRCEESVKDIDKAISYFEKSAELGDSDAMFRLGYCYRNETEPKNIQLSIHWYEKAASKGHSSAMYNLGNAYKNVDSVKDYSKAIYWYKLAADKGDIDGKYYYAKLSIKENIINDTVFQFLFECAISDNSDVNDAIDMLKTKAEEGQSVAQFYLGRYFTEKTDIEDNEQIALQWYKKSALQGYVPAQNIVLMSQSAPSSTSAPTVTPTQTKKEIKIDADVYEGNDKYIFISYAHKDSATVLPIVDALSKAGYRVWFDSGIEAGTEWPEYIEDHLMNSHVVLVFMSPAAIESRNCRNEINFALELKKEVLVIYLEETTLLKGMRLQLNSTQSLFRSHHNSDETFINELLNARIIKSCHTSWNEADEPSKPASVKPSEQTYTINTPVAGTKVNRSKWPIFVAVGTVLTIIIAVLCIVIFGGKKEKEANNDTSSVISTPANVKVEMSDNLFDYTIDIEGTVLKLPCKYEELAAAGWTISSSGYNDSYTIKGNGYESFDMSNNGKKISVTAYNLSGNSKTIKDCVISEIQWDRYNDVDIKLAKGITVDSTVEEIINAFGTPNTRNDHDDRVVISYFKGDSQFNEIQFLCYLDEENANYSTVTVKNIVVTDSDETETNTEKPAYLNEYNAPDALGSDFKSGIIEIGGDLYQLPAPVSSFIDNGWTIIERPGDVKSGNTETIRIERNGAKIYLTICNFADYQTTPENCAVCTVSVDATDNIDVQLSNGINFNSTKANVEAAVTDEYDYYEGSSYYNWYYNEYDGRSFDLEIYVDIESEKVEQLSVSCTTWNY